MSLRQNFLLATSYSLRFSYQSECHCAKTVTRFVVFAVKFSYQSECHCAKTEFSNFVHLCKFSYQSECHCAKTYVLGDSACTVFSYQSECHCAKTVVAKSPLQGDVHSDLIRNNLRTIKQVNHLFILSTIILN